ncbi:EF-hand domain-containing protein [Streptomyces sp. NPDC002676]
MTDSFTHGKSENMFGLFDTDHNGLITQEDFRQRADAIIQQFPQADPQKAQAVRRQYDGWWQELADAADSDHDGRITRDEFAAVLDGATVKDVVGTIGREVAEFALADSDDDGYINQQEIVPLLKAYGLKPNQAGTVMEILDKDHDGRISSQEYASMQRECYVSGDHKAPGVAVYEALSGA